jgi:hypothetical protein
MSPLSFTKVSDMTATVTPEPFLDLSTNLLYPGAEGVLGSNKLPAARAGVVPCQLRFASGTRASGTLLAVEENGWLLLVHSHVSHQGREIPARAWALEQPDSDDTARFRVRSMVPAGPVPVS